MPRKTVDRSPATKRFVWDTSAIVNIKEPNAEGYSPVHSFITDFSDGWLPGPYFNIFPALAVFEANAAVSARQRRDKSARPMLRDFWLLDDRSTVYPIDAALLRTTHTLFELAGFNELRGADLVFACIAQVEDAFLVTRDRHFDYVKPCLRVIALLPSADGPVYRNLFRD